MDRVNDYGSIIKRLIDAYADTFPEEEGIKVERIYDDLHGHYELLNIGWENKRRIHGSVLHIDVEGDKVWIQHDGTEEGFARQLVAAGIPKDHIVLAFHPPYKRPYTGYAVA
jgi:hypothetical protein